ncbi:MAG: AAA family ATPase [Syntrophorhabdales bacterium]|jgi:exodeoxyribonuclease V alpha subunit
MTGGRTTEIAGTIRNVTYRNSETGYMVLKLDKEITLCGVYPDPNASLEGARIKAVGEWKKHKSYGLQFVFEELTVLENEILYFLTRMVKGLGKKLALFLIESMGEEALEQVLDNEPEKLLEVKGIKEKKLQKIQSNWHKFKELKALSKFLMPLGATSALVQRIYRELKDETDLIGRIEENPFVLTKVKGIGFKTADRIARAMGIAPAHPFRVQACIEYVLFEYTDSIGNSCIAQPLLQSLVARELAAEGEGDELDAGLFGGVLRSMADQEKIAFLDEDKVTSSFLYTAEKRIHDFVSLKSSQLMRPVTDDIERYIGEKEASMAILFSDEQREAIKAVNRGITLFVLCGYAGTGKSTVAKAMLDLLSVRCGPEKIACCALSGIASDRIRKLTGYRSQTIYSLVLSHEKLPYDVVLVDESSMVNTELLFKLITKLKESAVFIMVGDPAQLPPIGAGNPFSDIIDLGIAPTVKLSRIYRQRADQVIALFANEIRQAQIPEGYGDRGYADFRFVDVSIPNYFALKQKLKSKELGEADLRRLREENSERIFRLICGAAGTYKAPLAEALQKRDYIGFIYNFQIITPMKNGLLGTENLNEALQKILNDAAADPETSVNLGRTVLARRDKVVHIQNANIDCLRPSDYARPDREDHYYTDRIYNGMLGFIIALDRRDEVLHVYYPADRTIAVYSFDEARELLRLAYALTIHKTQGSEYRNILIPMTLSHFIMLNNKLLYTAVTRAKEKVTIVGEDYAFKTACRKKDVAIRDTVLKMFGRGQGESRPTLL